MAVVSTEKDRSEKICIGEKFNGRIFMDALRNIKFSLGFGEEKNDTFPVSEDSVPVYILKNKKETSFPREAEVRFYCV